jgi:16S rRNA (uracil1498-N3)-methyltransferase
VSLVPFVHIDAPLGGGGTGDRVELSPRDRHHLTTVLRLRPGADLEVADGRGSWAPARLTTDGATLRGPARRQAVPRPLLVVAQGLPKGRKLDEIVRVCTELGADELVPLAAARSVPRLDGARAGKAVERWTAVARAACEQARRVHRPEVGAIGPASTLGSSPTAPLLVAHPGATPLPRLLDGLRDAARVTLAVGPEGGWSEGELERWTGSGAQLAGLGPSVLRTEHAAAAGLAVLAAGLGRWDDDGPGSRSYGDAS